MCKEIVMAYPIIHEAPRPDIRKSVKLLAGLTAAFVCIGGLTIFQDLIESYRNGYAFYFSESLLFKTTWFLFIPILAIMILVLRDEWETSIGKTFLLAVIPVIVHFMAAPLIALFFSIMFYGGRYDLYKFYSFALGHDIHKLVIIYAGVVIGYKYILKYSQTPNYTRTQISGSHQRCEMVTTNREEDRSETEGRANSEPCSIATRQGDAQKLLNGAIQYKNSTLHKLVINNGKDNTIVPVEDITRITAATPYVFVHTDCKKHLHAVTLKSITAVLDPNRFIRVHKSTLVNISKVKSYKSRLNGDYDIELCNGEKVRLSRTFAPHFKDQVSSGHRDTK